MTVRNPDREAIIHGKITEEPIREKPSVPTWFLKLGMAITGLAFGAFVLVHMVGNLKLFMPDHDGVPAIDVYGEFLRTMGEPIFPRETILWFLRIVLLVFLVFHIWGASQLYHRSHQSRGKFQRTNLIGGLNSFTARTMFITGAILLAFIIFHILDLTLGVAPVGTEQFEHGAVYANMVATFSRWPVAIWYVIAMVTLFLHLTHGIILAVSDLGITGRRWRAVLLFIAYLVPAVVMIGNIILPLSIATGIVS